MYVLRQFIWCTHRAKINLHVDIKPHLERLLTYFLFSCFIDTDLGFHCSCS